jgi:MFS family permease
MFVSSPTQLFLLQIGLGIAEALSAPIWDSLFASNMEDTEDTFHWSLATGHTHFVSGIAIAIGGLIAHYISFNALFLTMGIIQVIATFVQAKLLFLKQPN